MTEQEHIGSVAMGDEREYLARAIDPSAWSRHDTLVGFFEREVGADSYQETYQFMWQAGVRTVEAAKEWIMNDGTRIGWNLRDSLTLADRVLSALSRPVQEPVAVKPLEWAKEEGFGIGPTYKAVGGNIGYRIYDNLSDSGKRYKITTLGINPSAPPIAIVATLEAAKARAQSDYETRIRSVLAAPQPAHGTSATDPAPAQNVRGLSEISDEDLLAELHARRGRFSPDEYMSPDQSDDRAKVDILRSRIQEAKIFAIKMDVHESPLGRVIVSLAGIADALDSVCGNPFPARAFPLNTTLPGRESEVQK